MVVIEKMTIEKEPLKYTHEYGFYYVWDVFPKLKTMPFYHIEKKNDNLFKIPVEKQGVGLAVREQAWYKMLKGEFFINSPVIYGYDPLCMEGIKGKNIYKYGVFFSRRNRVS